MWGMKRIRLICGGGGGVVMAGSHAHVPHAKPEVMALLLAKDLGDFLHVIPIADIEPADLLVAVRKIEGKGNLESARRTLQLASMVFRYAVATARLRSDPTRDLKSALTAPKVTHYGAILEPKKVGDLLRAIDGYDGQGLTKPALQAAPHVFVRSGEMRHAEWEEFDLDGALWVIPAEKMKMRKPHHVPLSSQVLALLQEVHQATGHSGYVFPSIRRIFKGLAAVALVGCPVSPSFLPVSLQGLFEKLRLPIYRGCRLQ